MKTRKVEEGKTNEGISVLVYASPGIGKTYALQYLPGKTLIIDADNGTKCLSVATNTNKDNIDIVGIGKDACDIGSILAELESGNVKYDNVVLDTLTELDRALLTYCGRLGKNGGAPELVHYNRVAFRVADFCRSLRNLTANGINVIFNTWEQEGEIIYPSGEKVSILKPMLSGKASPTTICGLCDIIARLEISSKDDKTRFYRMSGNGGFFVRDRIYQREWCPIDELLGPKTEGEKKNEPK